MHVIKKSSVYLLCKVLKDRPFFKATSQDLSGERGTNFTKSSIVVLLCSRSSLSLSLSDFLFVFCSAGV
jgi:hypothetical protein